MERNSQSTGFSQHEKTRFNIGKLKRGFNTRTQGTLQRKSHYALKRPRRVRYTQNNTPRTAETKKTEAETNRQRGKSQFQHTWLQTEIRHGQQSTDMRKHRPCKPAQFIFQRLPCLCHPPSQASPHDQPSPRSLHCEQQQLSALSPSTEKWPRARMLHIARLKYLSLDGRSSPGPSEMYKPQAESISAIDVFK